MTQHSNDDRRPISEADLHGYLDGELSVERRAEVEAYLATHPEQAARVAEYHNLTLTLHRLFDCEETPENQKIESMTEDLVRSLRRRRTARRLVGVAAAVVILATGTGLATGVHDRFRQAEDRFLAFTQQATNAHLMFAGGVPAQDDLGISEDTTVVSWLSQRLTGIPVRAPDLSSLGYGLAIERILPSADGPAAQLMYRNEKGSDPVTLFIGKSRDHRQSAFTFVQNDDLSIFYWQEGPFAYSLAGNLDKIELLALAEEVNIQLTALPPMPKAMVQHRSGEPAATAKVGAVPATVPDSGAADGLVQPASGSVNTQDAGTVTERAPAKGAKPDAEPAAGDDTKAKPAVTPIPSGEADSPKKT